MSVLPSAKDGSMIKLASIGILALAAFVPQCTGTIWGNLFLLLIVTGIFFGTVSIGQAVRTKTPRALADVER
jgi:hypothetical protein